MIIKNSIFLFTLLIPFIASASAHVQSTDSVEVAPSSTIELLKQHADKGDTEAINIIGMCYQYGNGMMRDKNKAYEYYSKSTEAGNPYGMYFLSSIMDEVDIPGMDNDLKVLVAHTLLTKAAEAGVFRAQRDMFIGYKHENPGFTADNAKMLHWLKKCAEQNDPQSICELAYYYYEGTKVQKDLAKAAELYKKSAEMGYVDGMVNFAYCLYTGEGVSKNEPESMNWYRKAAAAGHLETQEWLKSEGISW